MSNPKNNVIDLSNYLNKRSRRTKDKPDAQLGDSSSSTEVYDMTKRRQLEIASERRQVTRTVLSHIVGVLVVLPKQGLQPVSLYDVSEGGFSFDLPAELGSFGPGETLTVRMYLSHDLYFSFGVKIANVRAIEKQGTNRHGAILKKADSSYKTLYYFFKFLESVSQIAKKDTGERLFGRVD